jgi:hypothetical protein
MNIMDGFRGGGPSGAQTLNGLGTSMKSVSTLMAQLAADCGITVGLLGSVEPSL